MVDLEPGQSLCCRRPLKGPQEGLLPTHPRRKRPGYCASRQTAEAASLKATPQPTPGSPAALESREGASVFSPLDQFGKLRTPDPHRTDATRQM